jgi:hypothetical protein
MAKQKIAKTENKEAAWPAAEPAPDAGRTMTVAETTRDKGTIFVEVRLTDEELKSASKALADAIQRKAQIDDRIKTFQVQARAELADIDARIGINSALVNSEKEFRHVPCEIEFNWKKGIKTFFRIDTGEQVRTESITDSDRQARIPGT